MHAKLFKSGTLLATPGAMALINETGTNTLQLMARHLNGDWGDLDDEDKALNDEAVKCGARILSAYNLRGKDRVWVITEAADDNGARAATTILLPEEY
jgi:hypothetical protein